MSFTRCNNFWNHNFVSVMSTAPKPDPILIEKAQDLACDVLPAGLLVIHNAGRCGEHDEAELTGREELDDPFLEVRKLDVVTWADNTGLVDAAVELNNNLAVAMVVDLLELANIAVALHDGEKLSNDLGRGSNHDLALARLLGVVDGVERIVEDTRTGHRCGGRFSMALGE